MDREHGLLLRGWSLCSLWTQRCSPMQDCSDDPKAWMWQWELRTKCWWSFWTLEGSFMQSVKRRHFPQTLIKLKRNNNQVVSLIYIRYKNYGVRFSRCWVPTAPSAQHMEKLQALLIKEKSFTVVWFAFHLSWVPHRSTADLPMLFWLFASIPTLNFGRFNGRGFVSIISARIWVHNQPFACVDRISKTLLRSSCVRFAARTAISVKK